MANFIAHILYNIFLYERRKEMRSEKEKKILYRILDELDKEMQKEEQRREKKVEKARNKMKVGSNQPSILSKMKGVIQKQF